MQHAQTANQPNVDTKPTPLPLRSDTFLGTCEALGEDLGFNPLWLRVALSAGIFWNPTMMIAIYLGLGVIVAISRLAFPARKVAIAAPVQAASAPAEECTEQQPQEERELIAA